MTIDWSWGNKGNLRPTSSSNVLEDVQVCSSTSESELMLKLVREKREYNTKNDIRHTIYGYGYVKRLR